MHRVVAGAFLALLVAAPALAASPPVITNARYTEPTTRYDHGILGDDVEWGALRLTIKNCSGCATRTIIIRLPANRVFEDTAPRLVDLDGRGLTKAMVVESDLELGARLAIYDNNGLVAATPFIGRTHRWLAPLGAADLDGDGSIELVYIDRPHLAKTLRIWQFENGNLTPVADQPGLTNHRIGENFISGGIRNCGTIPEIITANANWTRLIASTLSNGQITTRDIGPHTGPASFTAALACR